MPFKPGQSGNPGGKGKLVAEQLARFRQSKDLEALRAALRDIAVDVEGKYEARDRVAAIKEWFDRAFGKAPQAITGEDGSEVKISVTDGLVQTIKRLAEEK